MTKKRKYNLENEVIKLITMLGVGFSLIFFLGNKETQETIIYYVTTFIIIILTIAAVFLIYYFCNKHDKKYEKKIQEANERKKTIIEQQKARKITEQRIRQQAEIRARQQAEQFERQQWAKERIEQWIRQQAEKLAREKIEQWEKEQAEKRTKEQTQQQPILLPAPITPKAAQQKAQENDTNNYKKNLLSNAEIDFLNCLTKAKPKNLHVNYKTRLVDVIGGIPDGTKNKESILMMHVDFILVDYFGNVTLAIELDDSSHDTPDNRKRDNRKDEMLQKANIPLLRIHVRKSYDEFYLKKEIENKIKSRFIQDE
ncbi:MAG: DUF2726 domain-containing protein [Planctomycetaceae bacterium]|jgi:hypothetical protein|nr:DUF2726 domain-containing protein [Planctomycetaceae bacterium]